MKKKDTIFIVCLVAVLVLLIGIVVTLVVRKPSEGALDGEQTVSMTSAESEGNTQTTEDSDSTGATESVETIETVESVESKEPEESTSPEESEEWSIDSLKKGRTTAIVYDAMYKAYIPDIKTAEAELKLFGEEQRANYDNPKVKEIEKRMEENYGLFAVNLGEMDEETALDVERAFSYMYTTYPELNRKLTNITLSNLDSFANGHLAITEFREYIINEQLGQPPIVVKHQILLGASSFLKRDELLKKCENGVAEGHWPKDTDISSLVVHELGHQLLNVYAMQEFGYEDIYYVTDDNMDAYSMYITDSLKANQTIPKEVMIASYMTWKEEVNPMGSYPQFCASISDYAQGIQADGGVSYTETVAEAIADVYLHGDDAAYASRIIEETLRKKLRGE